MKTVHDEYYWLFTIDIIGCSRSILLSVHGGYYYAPPTSNSRKTYANANGEISPIHAFNDQYPITDLLNQYGYKRVYISKEYEKWISPDSKSRSAGITVKEGKFYSHHDDDINNGYWHDAFDLMRVREGLSDQEAVIKAAKNSIAPDGRTIDEYNKSRIKNKQNPPSNPIPHAKILMSLLEKISTINFRKAANLGDDDKLRSCHYQILTIETILEIAKKISGACVEKTASFIYTMVNFGAY